VFVALREEGGIGPEPGQRTEARTGRTRVHNAFKFIYSYLPYIIVPGPVLVLLQGGQDYHVRISEDNLPNFGKDIRPSLQRYGTSSAEARSGSC
jgi:hypothetical protein